MLHSEVCLAARGRGAALQPHQTPVAPAPPLPAAAALSAGPRSGEMCVSLVFP